MAAPSVPNWQVQILRGIGAPVTQANLSFLNAWTRAEGGSASNNPFNTTQHAPGAGSYNSVGVRNYTSPEQGIQATIQTLRNGRYGNILAALHQGTDARAAASALAASPWGTGSLVEKILGGSPGGAVVPTQGTVPSLPGAPPAPPPRKGFDPNVLALFNQGNEMFGLPELPQSLVASAPSRLPNTPGSPTPSRAGTPANSHLHLRPGVPVGDLTSISGGHPTMGLAGYPAHDYFAPAGSPVVAPVTGKVIRLSGHDPSQGPIEGPHGPLGWSVYIQGSDGHIYYLTHMGSRTVRVGETLRAGQPIGTVANYAKYGTPSHIHMGVH